MGADYKPSGVAMFEYQAPAVLNQAAPVQNTWYTILDTTPNVRIYDIVINVEDVDESLDVRVTIDGEILPMGSVVAAIHSTNYAVHRYPDAITQGDNVYLRYVFVQ